MIIEEMG